MYVTVVLTSSRKVTVMQCSPDNCCLPSFFLGTSSRKGQLHRMYSVHQKQKVAEYAHVHGIRPASRQFGISRKNIQRWVAEGLHEVKNKGNFKRKNAKGQGRKVSYPPEVERKLVQWLLEKQNLEVKVSHKMLKEQAIALITPTNPNFKASDGWSQKFVRRNNIVLQEKKLWSHESQKLPAGSYFQYENL